MLNFIEFLFPPISNKAIWNQRLHFVLRTQHFPPDNSKARQTKKNNPIISWKGFLFFKKLIIRSNKFFFYVGAGHEINPSFPIFLFLFFFKINLIFKNFKNCFQCSKIHKLLLYEKMVSFLLLISTENTLDNFDNINMRLDDIRYTFNIKTGQWTMHRKFHYRNEMNEPFWFKLWEMLEGEIT